MKRFFAAVFYTISIIGMCYFVFQTEKNCLNDAIYALPNENLLENENCTHKLDLATSYLFLCPNDIWQVRQFYNKDSC